ncbi:unnamed product [Ostreococcus tauri]|uniref:Unnamed product n=1 Tax=Ostreococcus tauri TaxID=70448 RepID=A0A096P8I6_OSTTA|nr:unnamed product [Ostreococcus tauri]CEG00587.1 unnamed product [Ostreococcus tauri]|eukprot:XP_022840460.1 unnamed product [Ostreococcus tauri]
MGCAASTGRVEGVEGVEGVEDGVPRALALVKRGSSAHARALGACEGDAAVMTRRRSEFWDTASAYGGDANVWMTLRACADEVLVGENAREGLMACGVVRCDAALACAYDALGRKYEIPEFARISRAGAG